MLYIHIFYRLTKVGRVQISPGRRFLVNRGASIFLSRTYTSPFFQIHYSYFLFFTPTSPVPPHDRKTGPDVIGRRNPWTKRNCTGHLLLRPPCAEPSTGCPEDATPPDAARRLASHFGCRPHIIGCRRIPIQHPSVGTLVPAIQVRHTGTLSGVPPPEQDGGSNKACSARQNAILGERSPAGRVLCRPEAATS